VRKVILFLGVGGVGKTTIVYRLMGLSNKARATLRPGIYRIFYSGNRYDVVDVPGQMAVEVAQAIASNPMLHFDRIVLIYDLVRQETYKALSEIWSIVCVLRGRCLSAREVVIVGNKRDLAEELGYSVEADPSQFDALDTRRISALKDPIDFVARAVLL